MIITFLGHASFLVQCGGADLLFDPYISSNHLARSINIYDIKADYIFASHGHIDHVEDIEAIYKNQKRVTLISTIEVANWYRKKNVLRVHPMNPGGKKRFPFGTVYAYIEAHSSSMPDGTYAGVAMGYVIESADRSIYFAGDTGLHENMKVIKLFHNLDYAILPLGGNFTMDIDQAVIAADFVGTNNIIGMHYDTNPMIMLDKEYALKKANKYGKKLTLMDIGSSIQV